MTQKLSKNSIIDIRVIFLLIVFISCACEYENYLDTIDAIVIVKNKIENKSVIGSGFFLEDGVTLITANHIIQKRLSEDKICLFDHDNEKLNCGMEVIFFDKDPDLAILQPYEMISGMTGYALCDNAKVGDPIVVIGYPKVKYKKSYGSILSITKEGTYVTTTAVTDEGASGGPIIDTEKNCVVGINIFRSAINGWASGYSAKMIRRALKTI